MKQQTLLSVFVLATALIVAPGAMAGQPVGVSPGSTQEVTLIDQRCPTFSWGAIGAARSYELVVYRLQEGVEASHQASEPVLRERLPGGALSWTPSMARCLSPGARYAWLVRSHGEDAVSNWSEPRLFQVAAGPSALAT